MEIGRQNVSSNREELSNGGDTKANGISRSFLVRLPFPMDINSRHIVEEAIQYDRMQTELDSSESQDNNKAKT